MTALAMEELLKLDLDTRLEIIATLWDSIVDGEPDLPLAAGERDELDRRLAAHRRDPDAGAPWSEVRARIFRGR